jgi:hypothetical protein
VDLIGAGDVRFGVEHRDVGNPLFNGGDIDPADTYRLVVRTGPVRPRELWGRFKNPSYTITGGPGNWGFTLSFRAVPIAWYWGPLGDDPNACNAPSDPCVNPATVASLVYSGFVSGYVTDLASSGIPVGQRAARTGFIHAYNAQDASEAFYNFETNALEIQMLNPHLRAPGVVATGSYETFITNAMLINQLEVPDPASLTGGSFTVRRTVGSTTTSTPFTLTHEPGGVRIVISAITFSAPKFSLKPKASRPGRPRNLRASRMSGAVAKLRFRGPLANGGKPITRYAGRCTARGHAARRAYATGGRLYVRQLTPGVRYTCRVRAYNAIGAGPWGVAKVLARRP